MLLKRVTAIMGILLLLPLFGCGSNEPASSTSTPKTKEPYTVKLAQNIIDMAVNAVKGLPMWSISLLDPTINLLTGIAVDGAIVLHNGNDRERMVSLYYTQETEIRNGFAPLDCRQWITIKEPLVRLQPMETRVVTITVFIPNGTDIPKGDYRFGITADAGVILPQSFNWQIDTGETTDYNGQKVPDDFLEVTMTPPLMLNDVQYITKLTSSIAETPTVSNYDPKSGTLRINGLKTSSSRNITLEYLATGMFRQAYVQNWYFSLR